MASLALRAKVTSIVQQHVLGDLLGDRGGADRPLAAVALHQVGDRGPQDGQRIDAFMTVEIPVLRRDEGLLARSPGSR